MNFHIFLKVFSEVSLYFGCIGALPALFPYQFFFLWPSMVCAACAGISAFCSDQGRKNARYPFLLLSATSLLLGANIMDILVLIPPVVYVAAMILRDEWSLEYFQFREGFRKTLTILGIAVVVVHFGVLIESRSDRTHVLNSIALLRHILIYAACGIILQRQLRLGGDTLHNRYLNTLQLGLLVLGTGAIILAIVLTESYLSSRGLSLGQLLGRVLQLAVGAFLSVFQYLFILLAEMIKTAKSLRLQDSTNTDADPTPVMPMGEMQQLIEEVPQEEAAFPWWLAVPLLVAFTGILILLTRTLGSRSADHKRTETISRIQPAAKERQPERRSNRSKVRRIYREFLKTEKKKGHKLQPFHTSLDILNNLKPNGNPDAAARLRRVYLSARYDLNTTITSVQVQEAKDVLKQYKNDERDAE